MGDLRVQELVLELGLKDLAMTKEGSVRTVSGGVAGDVLSYIMANARPGDAWVTVQTHENVVAVAAVTDVACVIVCQREVPEDTVRRAKAEGITLLWSDRPAFEVSGRLFQALGLSKALSGDDAATE